MRARLRWGSRERASEAGFWALIELLVVLVIVVLVLYFYLGGTKQSADLLAGSGGRSGAGGARSTPGVALEQAEGVACRNNLQNLRVAIAAYQAQYGGFPPDLEGLQAGVSLTCPVGGEPYQYDPATGKVHCTHARHEAF
jgi:type II secretory pathway pseudopilin PulG